MYLAHDTVIHHETISNAFMYHITSLPGNCTCMWQCNQTAPSILELPLQCSSFRVGSFPFCPSQAGGWQKVKPCASPSGHGGIRVAAPGQHLFLAVEKELPLWPWCLPLGTLPALTLHSSSGSGKMILPLF